MIVAVARPVLVDSVAVLNCCTPPAVGPAQLIACVPYQVSLSAGVHDLSDRS
jgi:hypothetical protein